LNSTFLIAAFFEYDVRWLPLALVLGGAAVYVATCRQALALFSRKRLLEITPEPRQTEVEAYLDKEDSYTASLRGLDLLLRLLLVLVLAFARFTLEPSRIAEARFLSVVAELVLLAVEVVALFFVLLEVLPGIIARVRPEERLLRRLKFISRVDAVFAPMRTVVSSLVRGMVILLGGKGERASADILEEEILTAAEEGEREGLLKPREIDMIESIIAFGNVEVAEVMTPRTEMVCLDVNESLEVNLKIAIECGHSRIPVFQESKDDIVGLLYVKDLLRYWDREDDISLKSILRKPHFVPLTKKIGELFHEFKTQRFHIAIILDEFGGTLGLVTIEDIIEEIVGEISDEYEKVETPPFKRVSAEILEVDGAFRVHDFNDQAGADLPQEEAYDTVGGLVVTRLGRIPAAGETCEFDSVRFEVIAADERRIHRLRVTLPENPVEEQG
jgi:CBS domain containing-hemolysin-like protein